MTTTYFDAPETAVAHPRTRPITELVTIIRKNDLTELDTFHLNNVSRCSFKLDESASYYVLSSSKEMVDKLFDIGYMQPNVHILINLLRRANKYEHWDVLNQILSHLPRTSVVDTYYVTVEPDGDTYTTDLLAAWTECFVIHYYGKIHPGARAFLETLVEYGCSARDAQVLAKLKSYCVDQSDHYQSTPELVTEFDRFRSTPEYIRWLEIPLMKEYALLTTLKRVELLETKVDALKPQITTIENQMADMKCQMADMKCQMADSRLVLEAYKLAGAGHSY